MSDWLKIDGICRLDTAVCSHENRPRLLSLFKSRNFSCERNVQFSNLFRWLVLREIKIKSLQLEKHLLSANRPSELKVVLGSVISDEDYTEFCNLEHLESLEMTSHGYPEGLFYALLNKCPRVTSFTVSAYHMKGEIIRSTMFDNGFLKRLKHLKLEINHFHNVDFSLISGCTGNLESFHIINDPEESSFIDIFINDEDVINIFQKNRNLDTCEITAFNRTLTGAVLLAAAENCPKMTRLHVCFMQMSGIDSRYAVPKLSFTH